MYLMEFNRGGHLSRLPRELRTGVFGLQTVLYCK
jgi:hypothetical protein